MIKKTAVLMAALVQCLGMFTATSVSGQPTTGMAKQTGVSEHHKMMSDMMKDMSMEIYKMTEQMGSGERNHEQTQQHKQERPGDCQLCDARIQAYFVFCLRIFAAQATIICGAG